jgi:hypothetical protein
MIASFLELLQEHPAEAIVLLVGLLGIVALREILWIQFYTIKLKLLVQGEMPGSTASGEEVQKYTVLTQRFTRIITYLSAIGTALLLFTILKLTIF